MAIFRYRQFKVARLHLEISCITVAKMTSPTVIFKCLLDNNPVTKFH
ncbi:MAG: hypothetical protein ACI822_002385 [Gammaproteobacteria bacterium]